MFDQQEFSQLQIQRLPPDCYEFSMKLTIRIRELRKSKGWTLEELAGRVGISSPHLSEIERGKKNLNNHLIERIARSLGVEHHELFVEGAGIPGEPSEVSATFDRLSDARKSQLLDYARFLALQQDAEENPQEGGGARG